MPRSRRTARGQPVVSDSPATALYSSVQKSDRLPSFTSARPSKVTTPILSPERARDFTPADSSVHSADSPPSFTSARPSKVTTPILLPETTTLTTPADSSVHGADSPP